jgi:hypothetical protein
MTTSNDRLDRIEAVLEKLSEELGQMRSEQTQMRSEQTQMRSEQTQMSDDQDRGRKGEDRTWDVVKWVGGISAGLSRPNTILSVTPRHWRVKLPKSWGCRLTLAKGSAALASYPALMINRSGAKAVRKGITWCSNCPW